MLQHRNLIIGTLAIIIATVVLISPVIPIQAEYIVTKTRARELKYDADIYNVTVFGTFETIGNVTHGTFGKMTHPPYVNVTNLDSIGGTFSVILDYGIFCCNVTGNILDTFSQTLFIDAGDTQMFIPPNGWGGIIGPMFFNYNATVFPPATQENYNATETKTEYKSVLDLLGRPF